MLYSNLGPPKPKKCAVRPSCAMMNERLIYVPPLHRLATNTRIFQPEEVESRIILPPSLLTHLSEEVLVLILEYLDFKSLVLLSKTCRLFHRLCLSNLIWRHRCRVSVISGLFLNDFWWYLSFWVLKLLLLGSQLLSFCVLALFPFNCRVAKCLSFPFKIFNAMW